MKITELLKNEIKEYEENIALISSKIRDIKDLYDVIKPGGKRIAIENSAHLTEKRLFNKLISTIRKNNYIVIERMIQNQIEYKRYLKETTEQLKSLGLSREIIYSDLFISNAKQKLKEDQYNRFLSIKEIDEKLKKLNNDIVWYIYDMIIEMYEKLAEEKESKKDKKKKLEYAYKALNRNEKLLPREIATITNLINNNSNDENEADILLSELNNYILSSDVKVEVKQKEIQRKPKMITYIDEDIISVEEKIDEDNSLYINYIKFLKSFNNFDQMRKYLNSFGNNEFIKKMIYKILNILSDDDTELKEILNTYITELNLEKQVENEPKEDITVLYYGFLEGKNRILNDIEKNIPKEYYGDVLKGINMILSNGASNKRENFTDVKKVYKVRINDIRISFKRLENNVYVILGVFCKKDNKGYDIVKTTSKRYYDFSLNENSIVNSHIVQGLWDDYINKNSQMHEEINSLLYSKKR